MKYLVPLAAIWFTVAGAMNSRALAQQTTLPPEVLHYADTVLFNGKILTADEKFSMVEAVAVRDGRFLALGPTNRILSMAGPNTRRIDLKGKTVTPGIYDMHGDNFGGGLQRHWTDKFLKDEPEWTSKEESAAGIKRIVAKLKPGEPAMLMRTGFELTKREDALAGWFCTEFTLEEMDALTPNNPVFFISGVNTRSWATNSKGAEVIKRFLPKGVSTPFPKPNNICLTERAAGGSGQVDGIPTPGQWAANDYIMWYEPPDSDAVLPGYRAIQRELNVAGSIMTRGHMGVPTFNGIHALWERGELTIRFRMPFPLIPQISDHSVEVPPEEAETLFRRWANMSKIGDNMLRVVGMRIPAVGGNQRAGSSLTLEPKIRPYLSQTGKPAPYGGGMEEQEAMEKRLRESFRGREALIQACRFGWDTAADHTEGDRAFREVIQAYAECLKDQVVKRPTQRLTTGHNPMSHPDDIALAAKLGVRVNISTGHAIGRDLEPALLQYGTERVDKWAPVKSFIKVGSHPSLEGTFWNQPRGSSDFYWLSKYITRKDDVYGRVWNAPEALTRQETLWAATIWGAEQLSEEKELGNIVVSKEADLLVIDKDYMAIPQDDIEKIKVLLTMVGGKVVYEVPGAL